ATSRDYLPLTEGVIEDHLLGSTAVGVYPLLKGDTCWFLACDFDGPRWALTIGLRGLLPRGGDPRRDRAVALRSRRAHLDLLLRPGPSRGRSARGDVPPATDDGPTG